MLSPELVGLLSGPGAAPLPQVRAMVIGSDLDAMNTQGFRQPQPDTLITIDIDGARASVNYPPDIGLWGDASTVLRVLLAGLPPRRHSEWVGKSRFADARARLQMEFATEFEFLAAMSDTLGDDAIVFADMCIAGYWYAGFGKVSRPRGLAYAIGWGTLGFAFPAAIGASLSKRRPVVSVSGDGGFLFACAELATAAQERLPLTGVVVDDGGYGMLRFDQQSRRLSHAGVSLVTPDFCRLASSFGVRSAEVEGFGADFRAALSNGLDANRPNVIVVKSHLSPPPTTTPRWYRGSSDLTGIESPGWCPA